jgi:hypothetical protein
MSCKFYGRIESIPRPTRLLNRMATPPVSSNNVMPPELERTRPIWFSSYEPTCEA